MDSRIAQKSICRGLPAATRERRFSILGFPLQLVRRDIVSRATGSLAAPVIPRKETVQYVLVEPEVGFSTNFSDLYQMGKIIGTGSFGQVHVGVEKKSGLIVAIKSLPKVRGKQTREKVLDRIRREVEVLQRLQGLQGVIRLLGCYEDEDDVQLVTEFCSGGDLERFAEVHGPLDEASLALVAWEVLKVIKACHDLGILHGDVKPNNFCLKGVPSCLSLKLHAPGSCLKAIDFGCAQDLGSQRLVKRKGTPFYMAPEIFAKDYGYKVDVWSTGVMLYWLFCLKFPFFKVTEGLADAELDEVAEAINYAHIPYDFGPWRRMSEQGKDFIRSCLTRAEAQRMSADEALQHPWFDRFVSPEQLALVRPAGKASGRLRAAAPSHRLSPLQLLSQLTKIPLPWE